MELRWSALRLLMLALLLSASLAYPASQEAVFGGMFTGTNPQGYASYTPNMRTDVSFTDSFSMSASQQNVVVGNAGDLGQGAIVCQNANLRLTNSLGAKWAEQDFVSNSFWPSDLRGLIVEGRPPAVSHDVRLVSSSDFTLLTNLNFGVYGYQQDFSTAYSIFSGDFQSEPFFFYIRVKETGGSYQLLDSAYGSAYANIYCKGRLSIDARKDGSSISGFPKTSETPVRQQAYDIPAVSIGTYSFSSSLSSISCGGVSVLFPSVRDDNLLITYDGSFSPSFTTLTSSMNNIKVVSSSGARCAVSSSYGAQSVDFNGGRTVSLPPMSLRNGGDVPVRISSVSTTPLLSGYSITYSLRDSTGTAAISEIAPGADARLYIILRVESAAPSRQFSVNVDFDFGEGVNRDAICMANTQCNRLSFQVSASGMPTSSCAITPPALQTAYNVPRSFSVRCLNLEGAEIACPDRVSLTSDNNVQASGPSSNVVTASLTGGSSGSFSLEYTQRVVLEDVTFSCDATLSRSASASRYSCTLTPDLVLYPGATGMMSLSCTDLEAGSSVACPATGRSLRQSNPRAGTAAFSGTDRVSYTATSVESDLGSDTVTAIFNQGASDQFSCSASATSSNYAYTCSLNPSLFQVQPSESQYLALSCFTNTVPSVVVPCQAVGWSLSAQTGYGSLSRMGNSGATFTAPADRTSGSNTITASPSATQPCSSTANFAPPRSNAQCLMTLGNLPAGGAQVGSSFMASTVCQYYSCTYIFGTRFCFWSRVSCDSLNWTHGSSIGMTSAPGSNPAIFTVNSMGAGSQDYVASSADINGIRDVFCGRADIGLLDAQGVTCSVSPSSVPNPVSGPNSVSFGFACVDPGNRTVDCDSVGAYSCSSSFGAVSTCQPGNSVLGVTPGSGGSFSVTLGNGNTCSATITGDGETVEEGRDDKNCVITGPESVLPGRSYGLSVRCFDNENRVISCTNGRWSYDQGNIGLLPDSGTSGRLAVDSPPQTTAATILFEFDLGGGEEGYCRLPITVLNGDCLFYL
ncbi:MAG: hypothetical protein ACP5NX_02165 [Candidatus Bilamarchaeaceae archaeon]